MIGFNKILSRDLASKYGIRTIETLWHICHIIARGNMASIYEKLGSNIRKYRKKLDISQEELAVKAKLDLTSVSEIESGVRNPSLKTLGKLAGALRVRISDLVDF